MYLHFNTGITRIRILSSIRIESVRTLLVVENKIFLQEKALETTKENEERRKNPSPRNRKACHSISTALLQCVATIGTQSTMERHCMNSRQLAAHP
jgi:hypothetical protein